MKRYAFVTDCHTGSTVPLVKQLLDEGDRVDLILLTHGPVRPLEAVDIQFTPAKRGLTEVDPNGWPLLAAFLGHEETFRLFVADTAKTCANIPVLRTLVRPIRTLQLKRICRRMKAENYAAIDFVGRYNQDDLPVFSKALGDKFVASLHEVCDHTKPDFEHPNRVLRHLFKEGRRITVYSGKSRDDLSRYRGCDASNVSLVPFGLFSSYAMFDREDRLDLPRRYGLMIGWVAPYKGLSVLVDAVRQTPDNGFRYVVAGHGNDPAMAAIEGDDRFVKMNWFLSNRDFAELLRRAAFVVCPYLSASQSGVPQSAYVFGRPVVASDLTSFRPVVAPGINGELFPAGDAAALAAILRRLTVDPTALPALERGAADFENQFPAYAWRNIAARFREAINR